jgi:ElaA protein
MFFDWQIKPYSELNTNEFYDLAQLRQRVFVVEQNCPYLDLDGKDKKSYHVIGRDGKGNVVATARILHPGINYPEVSIGRVVIAGENRGSGLGNVLMQETINFCKEEFGDDVAIRISAQSYLLGYYQNHGFVSTGKQYLEDDIPHEEMIFQGS